MTVLLSKIPNWQLMTIEDIINYSLESGITEIVNNYGYGISVGLNELHRV